MTAKHPLLFGPYFPPHGLRKGDWLACECLGRDIRVGGFTDALIAWPRAMKTGRPSLIVCDDLVRAIRLESELAVAEHWGVSVTTVWKWRKALDVDRVTRGTAELLKDNSALGRLTDGPARGRESARTPEARQKISESKRAQPAAPGTRKALLRDG